MTEIKIKRLTLENFKCHKSLRLDFESGNASIYGDNASGKTSVYDALTWLLFGKDSQGNGEKNIEIKPLGANGEVKDHDALTSVEAVLDVNGEEVRLHRTYKEVWTTKRGSSEATYDGNTSDYYVDGVPCKRNAFQDKVNELVDEDTFRMLTSVSHFANGISWQERRAVLFKVAGVMDDAQILATNEAFASLVESMGKLSLEDYKKRLLTEKRGFVGAKTEIPARISECQKTIEDIESIDFSGAQADVEALTIKKDSVAAQILALDNDNAAQQKSLEIKEAQLALSTLEAENKAFRDNQLTGSVDVHSLNIRLTSLQTQLNSKKNVTEKESSYISSLDQQIADSRNRWVTINNETFSGGTCTTCGQTLPAEKLQQAMVAFEAYKKSRLQEIEQTANANKSAKAQAENRFTKGRRITTYVMSRSVKGQKVTLSCTGSPTLNSVTAVNNKTFADLNGKVFNLRMDVDGLKVENSDNQGRLTKLEVNVDGISGTVKSQSEDLGVVKEDITTIKQSATDIQLAVKSIKDNGVSKVATAFGMTIDGSAVTIHRDGREMTNVLNENGMYVKRSDETILQADASGVVATDVTVNNYLIVGDHARFEDYTNGTDAKRTACFYIEEVSNWQRKEQ